MTTDTDQDSLLQEYAAALAEERWAWHAWKDPGLNEVERDSAYSRWKCAAERSKMLGIQLTECTSEPPPQS